MVPVSSNPAHHYLNNLKHFDRRIFCQMDNDNNSTFMLNWIYFILSENLCQHHHVTFNDEQDTYDVSFKLVKAINTTLRIKAIKLEVPNFRG